MNIERYPERDTHISMHHQMSAARTILAARVSPLEFWTVDVIPVRDLHKFPTKAASFITCRALLHKIEIALGTGFRKESAVAKALSRGSVAMDWNRVKHL